MEMEDMVATAAMEEEVVEKSFEEGQEGQEPRAGRHWELRGALGGWGARAELGEGWKPRERTERSRTKRGLKAGSGGAHNTLLG